MHLFFSKIRTCLIIVAQHICNCSIWPVLAYWKSTYCPLVFGGRNKRIFIQYTGKKRHRSSQQQPIYWLTAWPITSMKSLSIGPTHPVWLAAEDGSKFRIHIVEILMFAGQLIAAGRHIHTQKPTHIHTYTQTHGQTRLFTRLWFVADDSWWSRQVAVSPDKLWIRSVTVTVWLTETN